MHFKNYFLFEYAPIIKLSSRIKQNTKQIKTKKYKSKIIKCKNNFLIFCYHKTIKHRFNAKWLDGGCGGLRMLWRLCDVLWGVVEVIKFTESIKLQKKL